MKMKGRTSALTLSTIAMVLSFAVWAVLSPIATELQEIYRLTATEKSILVATPVLLGSLMRIPMGIITDRWGGRRVYTWTMLFLAVPLIGAGLADSYGMLLLWAFFIGMAGTTFAIGIAYVSRWYPPEKQGLALGITALGNFGTAVAGFTIPTIAALFGLVWVFWGLAAVMVIMAFLFWIGTSDLPRPKKAKTFKEVFSVVKNEHTWYLSVFYFLTFGSFVAFGIYLPTLLQDLYRFSAVDAGMKAAGFVTIATFVRPVGGYLADRFHAGRLLTILFAAIFAFALVISFMTDHFLMFSIGCLSIAFLVGAGNGAVFKLVPEVAPGNTGAVTGIVGAAGGIGGFFPPILLGAVKDLTGHYFWGFVLMALFALMCLWINRKTFDRRKRLRSLTANGIK